LTVERTAGSTYMPTGAVDRQGQRAGVASRTVAMVVDAAYVAMIAGAAYLAYSAFRFLRNPVRFSWPQTSSVRLIIVAALVAVILLTIAWAGLGRTIGMRFMGLRLRTMKGERIHLGRAFLRAVACVVFPLGLFWSAISKRNASVQDLVFQTTVVYDWQTRIPDAKTD
jgi:uncharacterized RDD family membrane protein YckC